MGRKYYYLIKIQYLGFRMHGWQHQPGLKTVEGLLKKTLRFVLPERKFKILGAGRTDAMVSATGGAFELYLQGRPLENHDLFIQHFNQNLPPDIRALEIREVSQEFNIIKDVMSKQYLYLFSFGQKNHPFAASLVACFQDQLDIETMKVGASLFEGTHSFHNYCTKPSPQTLFKRTLSCCRIEENREITASFFPEETFLFRVAGKGFLRNQIRLMMGALIQLGRGELSLTDIEDSLYPENKILMDYIAPGSGLMINSISFE